MMDYNAMQNIQRKLLLGQALTVGEKQLWHEFMDTTIFEIQCKQVNREKLSREEKNYWEIYASVHPDRINYILTDYNLQEYGRFLRGTAANYAQFEQEYISTIVPDQPAGRKWTLLSSSHLQWLIPAAAASILILIYPLFNNKKTIKPAIPVATGFTIKPASAHATLTLANNNTIELDETVSTPAFKQGNTTVTKEQRGALHYKAGTDSSALLYNTLSTPKGGIYHLELSDGTKVWLNAGSSLRYPVAFTGATRTVELAGEAYFEVAPNPARHFWVHSGDKQIEVKGTHFNVNSYTATWKVALAEGAIDLHLPAQELSLTQGQQATVLDNKPAEKEPLDTTALAWKEGYFHYYKTDIAVVLNDIARWYNLELVIPTPLEAQTLSTARISRKGPPANILDPVKDMAGLKYTFNGRKLIVTTQHPL